MQATIKTTSAIEADYRLKASPPSLTGLSKKSPNTAPNGQIRINAAQNKAVCDIFVKK
jgi:branched-subunit amino acid aminotransferase/4-amino-4-deoxychorismate lyase